MLAFIYLHRQWVNKIIQVKRVPFLELSLATLRMVLWEWHFDNDNEYKLFKTDSMMHILFFPQS